MGGPAKRLVVFGDWVAPGPDAILAPHADIEVAKLDLETPLATDTALARAHGCQALTRTEAVRVAGATRWLPDRAFVDRCPELLAISVAGAGYDHVDVEACIRAGIIVCNQSGTGREAVAEHALAFMLALSKKIGIADRTIRRSAAWNRTAFTGNDLLGRTVGIVGFGQIGVRLAELCRGLFAMTVLACDPYLSASEVAARGAEKVSLDELLERSDYVSLNGPLTQETAGMIGRAQFARMKPGAFFVTTARGGVHDEAALVEALASGRLGGAGVDVFTTEPPPPDHPLFAFDNVLATPHTAGITVETTLDIARATATQWLTIFAGGVPSRLVNPAAWGRYRERFEAAFGKRPPPLAA